MFGVRGTRELDSDESTDGIYQDEQIKKKKIKYYCKKKSPWKKTKTNLSSSATAAEKSQDKLSTSGSCSGDSNKILGSTVVDGASITKKEKR